MILKHAFDAVTAVLFPAPCRICGHILTEASRIPICPGCLNGFERLAPPLCELCGRPFTVPPSEASVNPLCRLCRAGFFAFDRARSFGIYDDALFEAILLMKYEEITRLGNWFADRLAGCIAQETGLWEADLLVPVPLHPVRRRERGYNQAELIARPLARLLNIKLAPRLLLRTTPRPPRLLLSRRERWKSAHGAYATAAGAKVDNLCVLLVDDVMTTGATLDACARALKKAGARRVIACTVARVVPAWVHPSSR